MKNKILIILILTGLSSCVAVQGFEKMNINDPDMVLKNRKSQKFETSFQTYREGSAGASGGKSGGGCGCN